MALKKYLRILIFGVITLTSFIQCSAESGPNSYSLTLKNPKEVHRNGINDIINSSNGLTPVSQKIARGGGKKEPKSPPEESSEMSVSSGVINLIVDLCPSGIMPLSYGIAAGGGTGLALSTVLLVVFGTISTYTMLCIGRACEMTGEKSLRGVWEVAVGKSTGWVVDACVSLLCFGCCVFFSAFIGDLFAALAAALQFPSQLQVRWLVLGLTSLAVILPLCLMEDLSTLKYTSFGGVGALLYTLVFVLVRQRGGAYAQGGRLFDSMPPHLQPALSKAVPLWRFGPGTLLFLNLVCVGFMAHYNAANYHASLSTPIKTRDTSLARGLTRPYGKAVAIAVSSAFVVFVLFMSFGFLSFGANSQPLLLNNYHPSLDGPASAARVGVASALLAGYPLMFKGFKVAFFNLAKDWLASPELKAQGAELSKTTKSSVSVAAVAIITSIAMKCGEKDVGFVIGVVGSLLGAFACYVLPSIINLSLFKKGIVEGSQMDKAISIGLIMLGGIFAIFGTATCALESFTSFFDEM